jgi:hypothetical protein
MAQQKIYLSKVRDFGENLGDTFQFIRQEFKPLFRSFALISGVFIVGAAIVSGIYQSEMTSVFDRVEKEPGDISILSSIFNGNYFLTIILTVLGLVAMQVCVAAYMKLYDLNSESPTLEEVWAEFRRHIIPAIGLSILLSVLIAIGLLLCILPGVYLGVVLAPAITIMVNENAGVGTSISRCFELIKENFWLSLGIYFVSYLIYSFVGGAIGLIIGIFTGVGSYLTTKEFSTTAGIVTSVANVFSYCFYLVFVVSVCLNYYNLAEKLDGFGMMKRLEDLGTTNPNDKIEEQY